MRNVGTTLKAHLAQQYQTLATCWLITLDGGEERGFTDHDQDIVYQGVTYRASGGYAATDVETTDALNVDNLEVAGMLTVGAMTEEELSTGVWDYASVQIFLLNWSDLSQGALILRVGRLGEVATGKQAFNAEMRGLTQAYTRTIVELTSPTCRASLGDHRCKVNLEPFTVTGTVESVDADNVTIFDASREEPGPGSGYAITYVEPVGKQTRFSFLEPILFVQGTGVAITGVDHPLLNGIHIMKNVSMGAGSTSFDIDVDVTADVPDYDDSGGTATPLGSDSGYFDYGVLTFTSGQNDGRRMEVRQYMPGMITLALPMPYAITPGDTYSLAPGCNKFLTTCSDKFDNVVNMRAEPYLPGRDKVMQVGRRG